jgi:tRNA(Ile)-lysidine synthase
VADAVEQAARSAFPDRSPVLVGVSGGLDSTVLLHALTRRSGGQTFAAHVNYGLRGADSDADEAFVRLVCRQWGVPLAVHRVPVAAERNRQAWARHVRYAYFRALARRHGIGHVAVAHHRDDQAETVLLALLHGAGPDALGGMRAVRRIGSARLHRPLLALPRDELIRYAERNALSWREDASNTSEAYERTHVRALLQRIGGSAAVARTAGLLRAQHDELVAPLVETAWAEARTGDALRLDTLRALRPSVRDAVVARAFRLLLRLRPTQSHVDRAVALVDRQVGRRFEVGAAAVWREREALRFVTTSDAPPPQRLQVGGVLEWGAHRLDCRAFGVQMPTDASEAIVPTGAPWPLLVRAWGAGDALYTTSGRRKVSDVLTDARVPPSRRAAWPVVCAGEEIVWVPGVRRADVWLVELGVDAVRVRWSQLA